MSILYLEMKLDNKSWKFVSHVFELIGLYDKILYFIINAVISGHDNPEAISEAQEKALALCQGFPLPY